MKLIVKPVDPALLDAFESKADVTAAVLASRPIQGLEEAVTRLADLFERHNEAIREVVAAFEDKLRKLEREG